MPTRKYMGISVSSQKTKNRNRSSETKTPIMAVSITSSETKKPFTNSWPEHQEQADAVHADVVLDGIADPGMIFNELVARVRGAECGQQERERDYEFRERDGQRDAANPGVVLRTQHQQRRQTQQRQEDDHRKQMRRHFHASAPSPRVRALIP